MNAQLGTVRWRRRIQRAGTISGCVGSLRSSQPPGGGVYKFSAKLCSQCQGFPGLAQEPVCKARHPLQVPHGCLPAAAAMDLFLAGLRCCCSGCKGPRSSTPDIPAFTLHREGLIRCPCLTSLIFTWISLFEHNTFVKEGLHLPCRHLRCTQHVPGAC